MLKALTPEGRLESGVTKRTRGKNFAYLAVVGEQYPARLAVAIEFEASFFLVDERWAHSDTMLAMQREADRLNAAMGLDVARAGQLVASTFTAAHSAGGPESPLALPRRRNWPSGENASFDQLLQKPPPRGAVIRFTNGVEKPRPNEHGKLRRWRDRNNVGTLVRVRPALGRIILQIEGKNSVRIFERSSGCAFYVESIPDIDLTILPHAQSKSRSHPQKA